MNQNELLEPYVSVLKKWQDFSSRTARKAFWMFALYNFVIYIALTVIGGIFGMGNTLGLIYSLVLLVPNIALGARRLHDIGKSGWWQLIGLIPFVGIVVLIIFYVMDSEAGSNKFGANPKGA